MSYEDIDNADEDDASVEHTYLTFQVGGEEYAVPVAHVTEIVRLQKSYAIPDVPSYVRGVINLRGKVIPLVDVRSRFGLADAAYTDRTVVVVLERAETSTGLVVDSVTEVAEIAPDHIEARGGIASREERPLVRGMGKRQSGISFILDVEALLAKEDTVRDAVRRIASTSGDGRGGEEANV